SGPAVEPIAVLSLGAAPAGPGQTRLAPQPDYDGLVLISRVEGGRWLPVSATDPTPLFVCALLMPDRSIAVIVDNTDATFAGDVAIRTAHRGDADVVRLSGIPSSSAASFSYTRCKVVHAEPRPRLRSASMKFHAAGRIDP